MTATIPAITSEYCEIRQSSIHHRGVFASRHIPAGARIIEYCGEKISKAESERRGNELFDHASKNGGGAVYLFILNSRHDIDGNVDWNTARLINHSCDPNCEAHIIRGRIWIVALRDIPEGEELGFNYGFDLESWQDHPCLCRSSRCAGYIAAEEYWPRLRRLIRERDDVINEITRTPAKPAPKKGRRSKA
jgi:uncharacterized protein